MCVEVPGPAVPMLTLPGFAFRVGHELLQRLIGRVRTHGDDQGRARGVAQRREIVDGVAHVLPQVRDYGERGSAGKEHRVAVGRGVLDRVRADDRAAALAVFDDHLLPENARERGRHGPHLQVHASRSVRNDDAYGTRRIVLRESRRRKEKRHDKREDKRPWLHFTLDPSVFEYRPDDKSNAAVRHHSRSASPGGDAMARPGSHGVRRRAHPLWRAPAARRTRRSQPLSPRPAPWRPPGDLHGQSRRLGGDRLRGEPDRCGGRAGEYAIQGGGAALLPRPVGLAVSRRSGPLSQHRFHRHAAHDCAGHRPPPAGPGAPRAARRDRVR